ncbi:MAG TPA: ACP S-malonyltransferase [Thermoleophilaceae bacterium]|nr:ACP S-malonyltransferase [Thermoleophilaceae bacterium]
MSASNTPTAILFPGQGSQQPGMREPARAVLPELVELADELCDGDPFARADQGTRFQQPALYCAALAAWEGLRELEPVALAGHSLGEITALAAAGALTPEDGLRLVTVRGALMQQAADAGDGGMMAVRGARADVEPLVRDTAVAVANDNSPRQVVLAGPAADLDALGDVRGKRLPVAGAFHSPLMEPAVEGFRAELERTEIREPALPVISCVTAEPFTDVREQLAAALTSPVRWVDVLGALRGRGVRRFVETGPGSVLTGLVRKTLDDAEAVAAHA